MNVLHAPEDDVEDSGNVTPISKDDKAARKSFGLYPDQMENVQAAITKAMGIAQSDKESHALDMICLTS